jgi:transposase InsO family protein
MDVWAHQAGVRLDFIRPGRPAQNGYIESINGRLRDECLNCEVFLNLTNHGRWALFALPRVSTAAPSKALIFVVAGKREKHNEPNITRSGTAVTDAFE